MKWIALKVFFLLIISHTFGWAQQDSIQAVKVEYLKTIDNRHVGGPVFSSPFNYILLPTKGISFFKEIKKSNESNLEIDEDEPSNLNWNPKGKNLTTVYKNYNHNEQYLKDMISLRFFTLKEKLDIFDWEVKEETKEILGFLCQLATGHFRGRDYEAWFALELPQGGPWKYDGLPGLILEIQSTEGYITYEPLAISIETIAYDKEGFQNPFSNDTYMSWEDFKQLYKEKAINLSKQKIGENGSGTITTPRMTIERYIDEDDPDYTADKKFGGK